MNETIASVPTLMKRYLEAETSARQLQEQPRWAIDRAELAERSARDAWAFAQGLMRPPRR